MNDQLLRVLMVEDSEDDTLLILRALKKGGYNPVYERVETAAAMKKALQGKQWDIILCDYKMPNFSGPSAISLLKEANIDIPLIIVTGAIGEETAAECMRLGSQDYILKGNLSRLCPAIARELEDAKVRYKQKQSDEALRESEIKYRALFESANDAIFLMDRYIFIDCNQKTLEMFGCTREQIIGQPPYRFSPEVQPDGKNSKEKALEKINAAIKGQPQSFEWKHFRYDGTLFDAEISLNALNYIDKYYLQAIVRDITERKQKEQALRETEERFAAAFHASPNLIAITRIADGKIVDVNEGYSKMLGYSRDESIGKTTEELSIWANPADRATFVGSLEKFDEINNFETTLRRKDSTVVTVLDSARTIELHGEKCLLSVAYDITERKRMERLLEDNEARLRTLVQTIPDLIWLKDIDGVYLACNRMFERFFGAKEADIIGKTDYDFVNKDLADFFRENDRKAMATGRPSSNEEWITFADDGHRALLDTIKTPMFNVEGKLIGVLGIARDITERKKTEEELGRLNRVLQMLSATNEALIHITDETKLLNEICQIAVEVGGYRMAWIGFAEYDEAKTVCPVAHAGLESGYIESANVTWADNERGRGPGGIAIRTGQPSVARNIPLDPAFSPWREAAIQHGYKSNIALPLISEGLTLGELAIYSVETDAFDANEVDILKELANDLAFGITALRRRVKQVQTEVALRESEERYRLIAENTADTIAVFDLNLNPTYISPSITKLRGYTVKEAMTQALNQILTPDSLQQASKNFADQMALESSGTADPTRTALMELEEYCKDGSTILVELAASFLRDNNFKPIGVLTVTRDITERKKAEEALENSEEKYRNIFENAVEGIYQSTTEGRFITANAALARMAGYDSPEELMESIKDIGTQLYVHPEDRKKFLEIREAKGFVSGFEVEFYKKDGNKFWVVVNARTVKDEQGKILYFEGLIEDITVRKHAEEQLHQTLDRLQKAVGTTIQVLVSAVESRDPYTAGHQLRVADLARAIATEMGFPQDKIEGIRMAGSIHDIGKLSIPAEILVKPSKLTNIEFSLIKEHSQIGYEMLKDVESPWPLAQIVYQHHERMNGSGYPRNLKGDEILIEARIMAVADVIEAMASHRPYRPALGIEAALEEIEKNKGIFYDDVVADACLKLFREKGYQLR